MLHSSLPLLVILFFACTAAPEHKREQAQTGNNSTVEGHQSPGGVQSPTARQQPELSVLARDLEVPWGMDVLPNGDLIVAERKGGILLISAKDGSKTLLGERSTLDQGEGGLLGLALDPEFEQNGWLYLYETLKEGNVILRIKLQQSPGATLQMGREETLLSGIPKARFHNGGILRFGPGGFLYAGTGDGTRPQSAQERESLGGKVLRMTRDGEPAPGNPFGSYVYSMGHRNIQGLAWDAQGQLYATEHGPSGEINGWCCHDELNRIEAGADYGWPAVIGDDNCEGCTLPFSHSGTDTWAPGGCAILGPEWGELQGWLIMACLRGQHLRLFDLKGGREELEWYADELGRLRNIIAAPDGSIFFGSSNRDGRGNAQSGDDKIYRIRPRQP